MSKRKVKLHLGGDDPWIDISRSGKPRQHDSDEDLGNTVLCIVVIIVILAWLLA